MIPHTRPDGSHDQDEHDEMEPFEGQKFDVDSDFLSALDLSKYDCFMVVFVRGHRGKLQQLFWPMIADRVESPLEVSH